MKLLGYPVIKKNFTKIADSPIVFGDLSAYIIPLIKIKKEGEFLIFSTPQKEFHRENWRTLLENFKPLDEELKVDIDDQGITLILWGKKIYQGKVNDRHQ